MNVFEKIIKRLEKETDCPNCSMYCADADMCGFDEMRKQAIEIVNQVASEVGDGWIPCSERLPDRIAPFQTSEYTVTMCFVKNGKKGRPFTSHASFDFESDKWLVKDYEVIAWREHIEPYKAESEG